MPKPRRNPFALQTVVSTYHVEIRPDNIKQCPCRMPPSRFPCLKRAVLGRCWSAFAFLVLAGLAPADVFKRKTGKAKPSFPANPARRAAVPGGAAQRTDQPGTETRSRTATGGARAPRRKGKAAGRRGAAEQDSGGVWRRRNRPGKPGVWTTPSAEPDPALRANLIAACQGSPQPDGGSSAGLYSRGASAP